MRSGGCIFLTFTTAFLLTSSFANEPRIQGFSHILKTIKVDEGDIVDCINLHKQPAFTHLLLANHTIQTQPSMKTIVVGSKNEWLKLNQSWHKYGYCPNGSIPIKRYQNSNHQLTKKYAAPVQTKTLGPAYHQHAVVETRTTAGTIRGGAATLNVWNPTVSPNGFSLSQIWLVAGSGADLNTMEAGWHVYPRRNGDYQTRIFIYWTRDGYQSTGCHDVVDCPGFVQTNNQVLIGGPLDFSTYGGQQFELSVNIQKDTSSGNWWLYLNGNPIGYWPHSLFTSIGDAADSVQWGGEVYDPTGEGGHHSSNQMGSGHFSGEGFQRSSYTRGMMYIDSSNTVIQPRNSEDFGTVVTIPSCYDLQMDNVGDELFLFFGGPGCA